MLYIARMFAEYECLYGCVCVHRSGTSVATDFGGFEFKLMDSMITLIYVPVSNSKNENQLNKFLCDIILLAFDIYLFFQRIFVALCVYFYERFRLRIEVFYISVLIKFRRQTLVLVNIKATLISSAVTANIVRYKTQRYIFVCDDGKSSKKTKKRFDGIKSPSIFSANQ